VVKPETHDNKVVVMQQGTIEYLRRPSQNSQSFV